MKVTIYYRFKDGEVIGSGQVVSSINRLNEILQEVLQDEPAFDRFDVYEYETGTVYRVYSDSVERWPS